MADTALTCDRYGFFNGIYGIEQTNWANYWKGVVPDGVVANSGSGDHKEMEVYSAGGLMIAVATGEAMVDNHKAWLFSAKQFSLVPPQTNSRIDTVVLRVRYGNEKESVIEVDVKTGVEAIPPEAPELEQVTGGVYEYALANITLTPGVVNLPNSAFTDLRNVFSLGGGSVTFFEEEYNLVDNVWTAECILPVVDNREYRGNGVISQYLDIVLPTNPTSTFICGIDFTSGVVTEITENGTTYTLEEPLTFQGVHFYLGTKNDNANNGTEITDEIKRAGDALTLVDRRYNLIIWWDGEHYWCAAKGA